MNGFCLTFFVLIYFVKTSLVFSANWAQHAGKRTQNTVLPYTPQTLYKDASFSTHPMWSPRWGHAVVILNQTSMYRNDLTVEQNSQRAENLIPEIVLLGGDDYSQDGEGGGYRNDIWSSKVSSKFDESWKTTTNLDPPVYSTKKWEQTNPGHIPPTVWPSGERMGDIMMFDDWIICQKYFNQRRPSYISCNECNSFNGSSTIDCHVESTFKKKNMWSPRRGHAAVASGNKIYVIGGRAREYVTDEDKRLVGESNIKYRYSIMKDHSTLREHAILKNDIWMSSDAGRSWELITPGCKDQQKDIIMKTELWSRRTESKREDFIRGSLGSKCIRTADCYGDAECMFDDNDIGGVCVCTMFGVREHHTVSIQHRYYKTDNNETFSEDYLYLVGGFTNIRQNFCSEYSCGSLASYRLAMDDAWVSNDDGVSWLQLKAASGNGLFRGRGSHTSILIHANPFARKFTFDRLFIFGGESFKMMLDDSDHLNDIWAINLTTSPCCYVNENCQTYPHPLQPSDIGTCLPDASEWYEVSKNSSWSPRSRHTAIHEPPYSLNGFQDKVYIIGGMNNERIHSDVWVWYLSSNIWLRDFSSNSSNIGQYRYINYYDQYSQLSELYKFYLPRPNKMRNDQMNFISPERHMSSDDVQRLSNLGINTFLDLLNTDLRTTLKLRGYDYPGRNVYPIPNICYVKLLIKEFLSKCSIKESYRNYPMQSPKCKASDFKCIVDNWDGCTPLSNYTEIDVHGIGHVSVLNSIDNPFPDLEEMQCKQVPTHRYSSAGVFVDGKAFLMGGQGNGATLFQDTWSRDDSFPRAIMKVKPTSRSTQSTFVFDSDEDGATQFEYKLFDIVERLSVTPWMKTLAGEVIDVSWLDTKKSGPGNGWYTLYVRAIDPSGNIDSSYMILQNVYTWYYIQPLPWDKITLGIVALVLAVTFVYLQYRRIQRKAALERFAKRRMKRKFKLNAMSGGGENDWRDYYHNQAIQRKIKKHKEISTHPKRLENALYSNDGHRGPRISSSNQNEEIDWKVRRRERRIRRGEIIESGNDGYSTEEEKDVHSKSRNTTSLQHLKGRKRYSRKDFARKKHR